MTIDFANMMEKSFNAPAGVISSTQRVNDCPLKRLNERPPQLANVNDKVYRVVIKQDNQEIFRTQFSNKDEFDQFVHKKVTNTKEVNPFLPTFIPIRTDKISHLAKDLLLPNTFNQTKKLNNIPGVLNVLAHLGTFLLDLVTLPIRCVTVLISPYVFNKEEHPLHAFLREKNPDLKLDDHVEVHLLGWKVTAKSREVFNKVREAEIAYQVNFNDYADNYQADAYTDWEKTEELHIPSQNQMEALKILMDKNDS